MNRSALLTAVILAACSGAPATPPTTPPTAVTIGQTTPEPAASPSLPATDDLTTLIPASSPWVVEIPDLATAAAALSPDQRGLIALGLMFAKKGIAEDLGAETEDVTGTLDAIQYAVAFGDATAANVLVQLSRGDSIEKLLRGERFEPVAKDSAPERIVVKSAKYGPARMAWYPKPRILVVTSEPEGIAAIESQARDGKASFATSARRLPRDRGSVRMYGDIAALSSGVKQLEGLTDAGSMTRLDISTAGGIHSTFDLTLNGARVPRVESVLAPKAPSLAARLPEETVMFESIMVARKPGKTLRDVADEIGRPTDERAFAAALDAAAKQFLGLDLAALEDTLAGEITMGLVADPKVRIDSDLGKHADRAAIVAFAETKSDAAAKKLVAAVAKLAKTLHKDSKVTTTATSIRVEPKKPDPQMRLEVHKGVLLFAIGAPAWMDRAVKSLDRGERTLASVPSYQASQPKLSKPLNAGLWISFASLRTMIKTGGVAFGDRAGVTTLTLSPSDKGLALEMQGDGGEVSLLGAAAAMGIYGARRYIANSKTAEAKNTIGAISRAATMAYERETLLPGNTSGVMHKLCKSAKAVPSRVPAGMKYQPNDAAGTDYQAGDADTGWPCLKFAMTSPQYYQYDYRQGSGYKGPARGGPDPGPDGFEASAEGDLDGNGKTSLFTRIGKVDKATQTLTLSSELFIADEYE